MTALPRETAAEGAGARCSCRRNLIDLALAVVLGAVVVAIWFYALPWIALWAVPR